MYTKEIQLVLQFITRDASVSQESKTFTFINILLQKFTFIPEFTFNPEINSNKKIKTFRGLTLAQLFSPKIKVSPANYK